MLLDCDTIDYLFISCVYAWVVWKFIGNLFDHHLIWEGSPMDVFLNAMHVHFSFQIQNL